MSPNRRPSAPVGVEWSVLPDAHRAALGLCDRSIVSVADWSAVPLHKDIVAPWQALRAAAWDAGFDLAIASGYRSAERQCAIWNAKVSGSRPVLNHQGLAIPLDGLSPLDKVQAVMRWSAVPGASRHHWGTDIDVYDRRAVPSDYVVQLLPSEYERPGPFAPLYHWLQSYLGQRHAPAFFWPYAQDRGGVALEPWHLSYGPVARQFEQCWSLDGWVHFLQSEPICASSLVLGHMAQLYPRFIQPSLMAAELHTHIDKSRL